MKKRTDSIIVNTAFRYITPLLFLYGVYVLIHGEYSPGGGFQAGAVMAMVVILSRLVEGDEARINVSGDTVFVLAGVGVFIYALVGWITIFAGGKYLEYAKLPLKVEEVFRHQYGILGIEIGVTLTVMATIIVIFDAITRKGEKDEH